MIIDRVRVYTQDGKTQDFVAPAPKDEGMDAPAPPKFQKGDLVRYIGPATGTNPIRCGSIGVVRDGEKSVGGSIGVEWAGWTGGHDLDGCARHSRKSGWFVSPKSIEHAT